MIIVIAILLWIIAAYLIIEQNLMIQNNLLKGVLSFFFTFAFLSFSFCCSLFAKMNFNLFQLTYLLFPLIFIIIKRKNFRLAVINIFTNNVLPPFLVSLIFLICLFVFSFAFFRNTLRWGDWDAVAIWNLHAKFLTYDIEFINLFTNKIAWSHPDYPLMLPSVIAMIWKSLGYYSPVVLAMNSYFIGISLILIIVSSFYEKGLKLLGLIVLVLLTCSGVLFPFVSTQLADTLLGAFILLPFILLNHLNDEKPLPYLFLIGFFAASSAWIKNEGLVFFLVFSFYFSLKNFKKINFIKYFSIGAIIPLIVLMIFKLNFAPSNDIMSGQSNNSLLKITDIHRYLTIIKFSISYLVHCQMFYFLLIILFAGNYKYLFSFSFKVIFTLLVAYFFVYLISPNDLMWHLTTSFSRLLYQVFPALLYTIFMNENLSLFINRYWDIFINSYFGKQTMRKLQIYNGNIKCL